MSKRIRRTTRSSTGAIIDVGIDVSKGWLDVALHYAGSAHEQREVIGDGILPYGAGLHAMPAKPPAMKTH